MKISINFLMLLLIKKMTAATVRKPPAFAAPKFSSSYLPATMQVIFHAVEQLKQLQLEGIEHNTNIIISSSPHPPGLTTWQIVSKTGDGIEMTTFSHEISTENQSKIHKDMQAVNDEILKSKSETTETYEGTLEVNYEKIELKLQEQKVKNITKSSDVQISDKTSTLLNLTSNNGNTTPMSINHLINSTPRSQTEKLNVDSVVTEMYGIVKPSTEVTVEEEESVESAIIDELDSLEEDENEETRFTLLGEKVTQVPRPSLTSYLRRSKVPLRASLQQLASLYDALSKDARKQGFATYAGYSDEVLKTLETSVGGGIGPQLKKIIEKTLERNELTREDTKLQAKETLSNLADSGSHLSTDLRRLLPLRYTP